MSAGVMRAVALCVLLSLAACAGDVEQRRRRNLERIDVAGWQSEVVDAGDYRLLVAFPVSLPRSSERLTVLVEGDGFAWASRTRPSSDPTPRVATGLEIALRHPQAAVAYLARPCQYVTSENCSQKDWTDARFSRQIIDASDTALDHLKRRAGARDLILIGYSGGGAVAALLAARRKDVSLLVTVAGNLDVVAWADLHDLTPLRSSLNPADYWSELAGIRQVHLVGAEDRTMPVAVARRYASRFAATARPEIRVIGGYDHRCCWAEEWDGLWKSIQGPPDSVLYRAQGTSDLGRRRAKSAAMD